MQGQGTRSKSRLLHLQAEITRLQAKRKQLTQQWRRSLGLNSSNSGKPPSSDGPA